MQNRRTVAKSLNTCSSIPVVSHARVLQLIRTYHEKYRKLLKPFKGRQNKPAYLKKLEEFREQESVTLFDIAACKCGIENKPCCCSKSQKVPIAEQMFLKDQRNERIMMIANVDHIASKKLSTRISRRSESSIPKIPSNPSYSRWSARN